VTAFDQLAIGCVPFQSICTIAIGKRTPGSPSWRRRLSSYPLQNLQATYALNKLAQHQHSTLMYIAIIIFTSLCGAYCSEHLL
jgi:hypothetical protein